MRIIDPPIYTEYACAEEDIPVVFVHLWGLVVTDIVNAGYDPETVHQAWCTALLAEETE